MTGNPTHVLNQTIALGDNPDDIYVEEHAGRTFIVLGSISIAVSQSSQAALDKLATATAEAAAHNRSQVLREVA